MARPFQLDFHDSEVGQVMALNVPLRFEAAGRVQLELVSHNGANLSVQADAIAFCLNDDASFAEPTRAEP
jgi:hypothetical protein